MPTTGTFDSWPADPMDLGPLYPLVGSEILMTVICFWYSLVSLFGK